MGGNSKDFQDEASKKFDALMKKSEKTKKPEKTSKAVKFFEDSDDSSPDLIIARKPNERKKQLEGQLQSDSISLQTISLWIQKYQLIRM